MIKIKMSKNCDTRSAENTVSKKELLESSKKHIGDVKKAMRYLADLLMWASEKHDWTKISLIDQFYDDFHFVQKNGGNFKCLPWYRCHITEERHHLAENVADDVTLIDVIEQIADITMAGLARNGKIRNEILPAKTLKKAYLNTIKLLQNQTEVEK